MSTSRHPGAPPGNTNALKHGFYSRAFRAAEQAELAAFTDAASLENEIQLMRVFILRIAQQETDTLSFTESLTLLNVMSRAALSLGSLLRTQRTAATANLHTELEELFTAGRAEYARADALLKRLTRRLAELEAAASPEPLPEPPAAEDEESDLENCAPPVDCLTCSEIAVCSDAPAHLRDLAHALLSHAPSEPPPVASADPSPASIPPSP